MYPPSQREMGEAQRQSLKELAKMCREFPDELDLEYFFTTALGKYYFPDLYEETHQGMDTIAGHMIYRLSDRLSLEERQHILLAPSETVSGIHQGVLYDTLEDWRNKWKNQHAGIPTFQRELSDILLLE